MKYKLLTPGPLTTTESVKREMLFDHCTWDDDYKKITQEIRSELLKLAELKDSVNNPDIPNCEDYTAVLMQGSGTFGVESVLSSLIKPREKVLILANGAYGDRMIKIAKVNNIDSYVYREQDSKPINPDKVRMLLEEHDDISYIAIVHSETTTGIINDIEAIGKLSSEFGKRFIVDAMSSFGGIRIPVRDWHIDVLISSANKCIQGVPGFSFIIARRRIIEDSKGVSRSLSLDLYDQYKTMNKDGKWRYTSPTHTVLAFRKAIEELKEEGGIEAREKRYRKNNELLIDRMSELGFRTYIKKAYQGPFITSFLYPDKNGFDFKDMYEYLKEKGFVIYPGKLTDADSFRIGNIGEIYPEDIERLTEAIADYMADGRLRDIEAVIFDWAGTTVDFGCMAPVAAFRDAFKEKGIDVTNEEIRKPMGMLKIDHIREMLKMDRISELWKEKYGKDWAEEDVEAIYEISEKKLLSSVAEYTDPKPYLLETVERLRSKGIKIGSTTGYTDGMMDIVTAEAAKKGYSPDFWITPDSTGGMGRPYPYMIFKNLEFLNISSPKNAVKIGDTISDIKEGKNAGMISIGILEGSSLIGLSEEEFSSLSDKEREEIMEAASDEYFEAGADYVINNLSELEQLLSI